ncbi:MAG TPA: hypothetical protein VKZ63_14270 [Kofleriaceae bacterium]|nr:hypothetical protein [Kofleriaceae bacterium]
MRPFNHIAVAVALGAALSPGCTGGGAAVGEECTAAGDCMDGLQCLGGLCTPACELHVECGDGYRCDQGTCALVTSEIGDRCEREIDCGPGQICALDGAGAGGDGPLAGTCQAQPPGLVTGQACEADSDCRSGVCAIGLCTEMCQATADCAPGQTCALIPRLLPDAAPIFSGCLPRQGVAVDHVAVASPRTTLRVPVPSTARSFALVARVDSTDQMVGATRVVDPAGRLLFANPATTDDFYRNPLRYAPGFGISTLLVPNTPDIDLQVGAYEIDVASLLPVGGTGTAVPEVTLFYKLDTAASLDLHFHFLDLTDHPCAAQFDGGRLDATSAGMSPRFQQYVSAIDAMLAPAGLTVGEVTYRDIGGRGDLDAIRREHLGELLALSDQPTGVSVFVVRSVSPVGVQALVGGTPGPPRTPGTAASGIAVGADTLCYRSWDILARITAHALARQMGLYFNRAPDGALDTISDSDDSADNLMFFSEFGGTSLSEGQRDVLRRYPGLR